MITIISPQTVDVPASLGWRVLAQIVDLTIVFFVFGLVISIYMATGIDVQAEVDNGWLIEVTFAAIVFCYFTAFEGLLAATPGKMAAGLRVAMRQGGRPTGPGIVIRNLVRIPEMMFWYIPSIISVAASPDRRRIGDFAGGTMVLRRQAAPQVWPSQPLPGRQGPSSSWQGQGPPGWRTRPPEQWPGQTLGQQPPAWRDHTAGSPPAWQGQAGPGGDRLGPLVDWPSLAADACLRGAHNLSNAENAYRLMAEREHVRLVQFGLTEAGSEAFSAEYVSAWDALAEAVVGLQQSYHRMAEVLAGQDIAWFVASRPPLASALRSVDDYLPAASDDDVVATFRRRLEAAYGAGA